MPSRHAAAARAAHVDPLTVRCRICAADVKKPCRDITAAPLVIKKNKDKRAKEMVSDLPVRTPHEARIQDARNA